MNSTKLMHLFVLLAFISSGQVAATSYAQQQPAEPNVASERTNKTVSPDGRLYAEFYQDGWDEVISIHDAKSGKQIKTIVGHGDMVQEFKFTADGKLLASRSERRGWAVWNVETGKLLIRLPTAVKNGANREPGIFVKVLLPIEPTDSGPKVETWIEKELQQHGHKKLRAMTDWIELSEEKSTAVWESTVDGKHWGCPVDGIVTSRVGGKVEVELSGWAPVSTEISGSQIDDKNGARAIATVSIDSPVAFFAMTVGKKKSDD